MSRLDYIPNDGYAEEGYVAAMPHVHGSVSFSFRPLLVEEQAQLFEPSAKMKPDAAQRKYAAVLSKRVLRWSILNETGEILAISPVNLLSLKPALFTRLFNVVVGVASSDTNPDWPEAVKDEAAEDEYESALGDKSIGAARQERNEGN